VTAGYDRIVAKWRKQKVLWKVTTQSELISAAYHPSANTVVAGSLDGHVIVLNGESGVHVTTVRICASPINTLAFSRAGGQLAIGAHTGVVHIFRYFLI
jgi:WD40 repeat protein